MDKITSYDQIQHFVNEIRRMRSGYLTNFYLDMARCEFLIGHKLLSSVSVGKSFFIFQEDHDFYHLFYLTTNPEQLKEDLDSLLIGCDHILTVDLIGAGQNLGLLKRVFESNKFSPYNKLVRMSRLSEDSFEQEGLLTSSYALKEDAQSITDLLNLYFDPYCEQIPMLEEIENYILKKQVLIIEIEDIIAGFIIFELNGLTSYLRYWFVDQEYRDKKLGSSLLKRYFYESRDTKRQLFWVIETNENAVKRYKHFSFKEENMYDEILIYNRQYCNE